MTIEHGGDLADVEGGDGSAWLDLSTGINPWPYPHAPVATASWTRLPGRGLVQQAVAAAALAYGVPDPSHVALGPGSQALIHWLPHLFPGQRAAIVSPSYSGYAQGWEAAARPLAQAPDLAAAVAQAGLVLVTNPNNPDGRRHDPAALLQAADQLAARDGLLVVDEAFADLDEAFSVAGHAGRPGLVVLRSFGKFYGLAGVRIGALLGPADLCRQVTEIQGPWAVSGPALELAARAWSDRPWQDAMRKRLSAAAGRLDALLAAAGLKGVGGTALYRLVACPRAHDLADRLAARQIFVRRFTDWPDWLRLGLPPGAAAEQRLRAALAEAFLDAGAAPP